MNTNTIEQMWSRAYPYVQRGAELVWFHCSQLCRDVRVHFAPTKGMTGVRAIASRFANLWSSGNYGKTAIVGIALILCLIWSIFSSEDALLVPQSGKHPKDWYEKFEEEPYGLVGVKGLNPIGKTKDGKLIFSKFPALSEVRGAFMLDNILGISMRDTFETAKAKLGFGIAPPKKSTFEFPAACHRDERVESCKNLAKYCASYFRRKSEHEEYKHRMWELESEMAQLDMHERADNAFRRQIDRETAIRLDMTLPQYDRINADSDSRGNKVFKGSDGETYEIDSNGTKWWLHKGDRLPIR